MRLTYVVSLGLAGVVLAASGTLSAQERLPSQVAGTWKITRVLPVSKGACWTEKEALPLVGSLLHYGPRSMRWEGGEVPLMGVTTHTVTSNDLASESVVSGTGTAPALADLGIHTSEVLEVNLQHEDADITAATTEVPGDAVLVAGPGRIVVSACGVYLEARRVGGGAVVRSTSGLSARGLSGVDAQKKGL